MVISVKYSISYFKKTSNIFATNKKTYTLKKRNIQFESIEKNIFVLKFNISKSENYNYV